MKCRMWWQKMNLSSRCNILSLTTAQTSSRSVGNRPQNIDTQHEKCLVMFQINKIIENQTGREQWERTSVWICDLSLIDDGNHPSSWSSTHGCCKLAPEPRFRIFFPSPPPTHRIATSGREGDSAKTDAFR